MMVHDVMDWIKAPLSIAVFGFLFWQLNHLLHRRMGVAYGQIPQLSGGETSFDRWMGIATMLLLLPLILVFYWFDSPYIRIGASVVWPVVVMIALGFVRHLHSVSSILFQAGHGASVSLITWFVTLRPDAAECSASASSIPVEPRIALLTYCASLVQFWINTWLTACLAFTAIFAATFDRHVHSQVARFRLDSTSESTACSCDRLHFFGCVDVS